MVTYYKLVFIFLNWICFSTEEVFNQTQTASSMPNPKMKNDTQSTTVHSLSTMTTAVQDTVVLDINELIPSSYDVSDKESKIVGGHETHEGEFPYQVSIRGKHGYAASFGHFCGGSIISRLHVLTAAHCMYGMDIHNMYVTVGSYDLLSTAVQTRSVYRFYIHAGYNEKTYENDIAIIQVDIPFVFNNLTFPIRIPKSSQTPKVGTNCTVSGWGQLDENYTVIPRYLHAVDVPVYDLEVCAHDYGVSYSEMTGMICAGLNNGGKDACKGDSGGPMVCDGHLSGVVSWGYGCAERNFPGVYTDVAYFYRWIHTATDGLSAATRPYTALHPWLTMAIMILFLLYSK